MPLPRLSTSHLCDAAISSGVWGRGVNGTALQFWDLNVAGPIIIQHRRLGESRSGRCHQAFAFLWYRHSTASRDVGRWMLSGRCVSTRIIDFTGGDFFWIFLNSGQIFICIQTCFFFLEKFRFAFCRKHSTFLVKFNIHDFFLELVWLTSLFVMVMSNWNTFCT